MMVKSTQQTKVVAMVVSMESWRRSMFFAPK